MPLGLAQAWKERADREFARGLSFDLGSKQFVVPEVPEVPEVPGLLTVFDLTEMYFRQHPEWEPATKTAAARSFNRARRWLLVPGAAPDRREAEAVADFLRSASFLPDHLAGRITDRQRAGRTWLEAHSVPADMLTSTQVEEFVARFETSERDEGKRVSPATMIRFLQPLKECWTWAVNRDDLAIARSPWTVVRTRRKVKGKATMVTGRAGLAVDADMVLSAPQSLELAEACATEGAWGGIVECCVLVMALCGLRWGEVTGVLWDDIELPAGDEAGWLVVRRTYRPTSERWLDPYEDPGWWPLKDRDVTESRRVPVPPLFVAKLWRHRELYGEGPRGLVFHRSGRPFDTTCSAGMCGRPLGRRYSPAGRTCLRTTLVNPNSHDSGTTIFATPLVRGGSGRASTPSSASGGRVTESFRCSSTSTRASPLVARTVGSSGWHVASGSCQRRSRRCQRGHRSDFSSHISYQSDRTRMSPYCSRMDRGNHGAPRPDALLLARVPPGRLPPAPRRSAREQEGPVRRRPQPLVVPGRERQLAGETHRPVIRRQAHQDQGRNDQPKGAAPRPITTERGRWSLGGGSVFNRRKGKGGLNRSPSRSSPPQSSGVESR